MSIPKRHLIFWITIYFFWTYMKAGGFNPTWLYRYSLINLVNVAIYMTAYYFLKHIQIPNFYNRKKYLVFIASLFLSTMVLYIVWRIFGLWWIDEMRNINSERIPFRMAEYLTQIVQFYSPAILLLVWDMHENRTKERERMHQLEKEKLATELKFLKAQLNPHFLFNTLNNLYSYVVNKSPKAPEMILHLSAILDYILYKSQKVHVSLNEELEVIENFIKLERIRYGERLTVELRKSGNFSELISPLILLSLVENAFKHGASGDIDNPKIDIEIIVKNKFIHCNIWNTKSSYLGELTDAYKKGIGLSNIRRQLNLSYPERYIFEIEEQKDAFKASLTLIPTS